MLSGDVGEGLGVMLGVGELLEVGLLEPVVVDVSVALADADADVVAEPVADPVAETDADIVAVAGALADVVAELDAVGVCDKEGADEAVTVADGEGDLVGTDGCAEAEAVTVRVTDAEPDAEAEDEGDSVGMLGCAEGEALLLPVADGEKDGKLGSAEGLVEDEALVVREATGERETLAEAVPERVGEADALVVAEAEGVGMSWQAEFCVGVQVETMLNVRSHCSEACVAQGAQKADALAVEKE